MVQSPRSVKQPDVPGVDVHGSDVVVVVLVEVDVVDVEVLLLLEELVTVVEVVGTMSDSGSPQCASAHVGFLSSSPTARATRHVFEGSAQWENGKTAMSQSVGISHRGARGSTQMHPPKNWTPIAYA